MSKIKKYGIILTTVFTVFASSLIVTKAATPQIQVSQYHGQLFQYSYSTATGLPNNAALIYTIFINTSEVSTGTVTLNLSNSNSTYLNQIDGGTWYGENCRITYNSNTHILTVKMDHTDFCTVNCFITGMSAGAVGGNLSWTITNSLTVDTDTTTSKLQEILDEFGDLNTYAETIKNDLHSLYLLIVDMTGDVQDINDHMTTVLTRMNTIITSLGTTNTGITTIQTLINATNGTLSQILTAINAINDNNYNIPYESLMAYAFFREMATGGIKTLEGYYAPYYPISSLTKTHVLLRTGYTYYLSYMVNRTNSGYISSIQNESGTTNANYSVVDGLPLINGIRVITYQITVTTQDYYNFTFDSSLSGVYVIPLYYGNGEHISEEMKSITGINTLSDEAEKLQAIYTWLSNFTQIDYTDQLDDIYTWLTNYSQIDYTNQLNEVIDAINGLQPNQNTTTNITNFNTNMDIITDIENDFSVDFGNYDTTFRNNNTERWTFDTNKQLPVNKLHEVFSQVINIIPVGTTWLSIVLLGAVLIAILG